MNCRTFALLTSILFSSAFVTSQVLFEGRNWISNGNLQVVNFNGKTALQLTRLTPIEELIAYCPDDDTFENGVIEMDIASPHSASTNNYLGLVFRMQDMNSFENLYFRPHLSGAPNMIQYEPTYNIDNDINVFLRHRDPEFQQPATVPANDWFHVKLVISGLNMEVYVDSETTPSMIRKPLLGLNRNGYVGLKLYGGLDRTALFANIVITPDTITSNTNWQSFQSGALPTVTYVGVTDAWIDGNNQNTNYQSATTLTVVGQPDGSALFRWDISSIAGGNIVSGAWLIFDCSNTTDNTYPIYELKQDWQEANVNWNEFDQGQSWNTAGGQGAEDRDSEKVGDYVNPVIAENNNLVTGSKTIELNAAGISMVQRWIDIPDTNHGIIIQDYSDASSNELGLSSSETASAWLHPKLIVEYDSTGSSKLDQARKSTLPVQSNIGLNIWALTESQIIFTVESHKTVRFSLNIYDISGRLIWGKHGVLRKSDNRKVAWNYRNSNLSSGMYFAVLEKIGEIITKSFVILR